MVDGVSEMDRGRFAHPRLIDGVVHRYPGQDNSAIYSLLDYLAVRGFTKLPTYLGPGDGKAERFTTFQATRAIRRTARTFDLMTH